MKINKINYNCLLFALLSGLLLSRRRGHVLDDLHETISERPHERKHERLEYLVAELR
jgi:hypothetical protein